MSVSSGSAKITLPSDTELLITRELDAPVRLVYEAWTTPELVKQWWAGHRGQMTLAEIDLRVGGRWRYVMIAGSSGQEVGFTGEYREIVPEERIVRTEIYEAMPDGDPAIVTDAFEARDDRTILTMLMEVPSKEIRDMVLESGMEIGVQEQLDLLERLAAA